MNLVFENGYEKNHSEVFRQKSQNFPENKSPVHILSLTGSADFICSLDLSKVPFLLLNA